MRLGIAHHYGWAVAVTASADHEVLDRRRMELIEHGLPAAPIHHEGGPHSLHQSGAALDDEALAGLSARVRASVARATAAALDDLALDARGVAIRTADELARSPDVALRPWARVAGMTRLGARPDA